MSNLNKLFDDEATYGIEFDDTSPLRNRPERRTTFAEEALSAQEQLNLVPGTPARYRSRLPFQTPATSHRSNMDSERAALEAEREQLRREKKELKRMQQAMESYIKEKEAKDKRVPTPSDRTPAPAQPQVPATAPLPRPHVARTRSSPPVRSMNNPFAYDLELGLRPLSPPPLGPRSAPVPAPQPNPARPVPPNDDNPDDDDSSSTTSSSSTSVVSSRGRAPVRTYTIGGEVFEVVADPDLGAPEAVVTKLWNKHERARLKPDRFQLWYKQLTTKVFPGKGRLEQPDFRANIDGTLKGLNFIDTKLRLLEYHFYKMDTIDVFQSIVRPIDISRTAECLEPPYNLFVDHYKLTAHQVALSCLYWRTRIGPGAPYILQNLQFTVDCLEQNTSDSLWSKVLGDMSEFPIEQQGGPLALFLVLKRIRNTSEAAMDTLKTQFRKISIKKIPGEDVDVAVSYIKAIHRAFVSASRPDRSFVPDNFCETCYVVMQTSSVEAFNRVFRDEKEALLREGDKKGVIPQFPSYTSILNLATATYTRLQAEGKWNVPSKKEAALAAQSQGGQSGGRSGGRRPFKGNCFNCGSPKHPLPLCPHPRDEAKIAKAREEFLKNRKQAAAHAKTASTPSNSKSTKRDAKGRALVLNKNNEWVVDQKQMQAQKAEAKRQEATKELSGLVGSSPNSSSKSPPAPQETKKVSFQETPLTPSADTLFDAKAVSRFAEKYIR